MAASSTRVLWILACVLAGSCWAGAQLSADEPPPPPPAPRAPSSFSPVVEQPFAATRDKMKGEKAAIQARQKALLEARYDLASHPATGVAMSRGKPVQAGVRVKLPAGVTWEQLGATPPEEIRAKGLWPAGFLPLPHPNHAEGGMVFPNFHITEVKKQTDRDLTIGHGDSLPTSRRFSVSNSASPTWPSRRRRSSRSSSAPMLRSVAFGATARETLTAACTPG